MLIKVDMIKKVRCEQILRVRELARQVIRERMI